MITGIIRGGRDTDKNFKKRLAKRAKLVEAHNKGKLSKTFYSTDKKTGKKFLNPKKIYFEGC